MFISEYYYDLRYSDMQVYEIRKFITKYTYSVSLRYYL